MTELYSRLSSDTKRNAQMNLKGRTHYVDDDTLRYFRARILMTRETDNGLLFAILESASADSGHQSRIFRGVVFDVFGTVLSRPSIEQAHKTRKAAEKALWKSLDAIDAHAVTMAAIEAQRNSYAQEMDRLAAKIAA